MRFYGRMAEKGRKFAYIRMIIQSWTDVVVASLQNLWFGVVAFVPNLIGAIIIFIMLAPPSAPTT